MNGINSLRPMNCSPSFSGFLLKKAPKIPVEKAADILKNKGVLISSCTKDPDRLCHTVRGVVTVNHNGKNYNVLVPTDYINGGYYSLSERCHIPYKLDEEKAASYILEEYRKFGEDNMMKFLEKCEKSYKTVVL